MSPEDASTLTLIYDVPEEHTSVREMLVEQLSEEERPVGRFLVSGTTKGISERVRERADAVRAWAELRLGSVP